MVSKGQARHEHPGQELRQVADDDEGRARVPVLDGEDAAADDRKQPAPAENGVQEGAEGALRTVVEVFQVVKDGPRVHEPLVPAARIGVRRDEVGVVFPHIDLVVQDDVGVVLREVHAQAALQALGRAIVIVARVIDGGGQRDEEDEAEGAVGDEIAPEALLPPAAYPV